MGYYEENSTDWPGMQPDAVAKLKQASTRDLWGGDAANQKQQWMDENSFIGAQPQLQQFAQSAPSANDASGSGGYASSKLATALKFIKPDAVLGQLNQFKGNPNIMDALKKYKDAYEYASGIQGAATTDHLKSMPDSVFDQLSQFYGENKNTLLKDPPVQQADQGQQ